MLELGLRRLDRAVDERSSSVGNNIECLVDGNTAGRRHCCRCADCAPTLPEMANATAD